MGFKMGALIARMPATCSLVAHILPCTFAVFFKLATVAVRILMSAAVMTKIPEHKSRVNAILRLIDTFICHNKGSGRVRIAASVMMLRMMVT